MLLKPTHEITFSGLPKDILDTYVRYKKGTRAIVCWLTQYAPNRYAGVKSLPLKELACLAKSVAKQIPGVPDIVHFYFRETIAARDRLSKYFRKVIDQSLDDFDTVNHEHFTTSLAQIYAELCECCGQSVEACQNARPLSDKPPSPTSPSAIANRFADLQVEDVPESHDLNDDELDSAQLECPTTMSNEHGGAGCALADDGLDAAMELACLRQSVQVQFTSMKHLWKGAAESNVNVVTAAFLTNVHEASLKSIANRLVELNAVSPDPRLCNGSALVSGSQACTDESDDRQNALNDILKTSEVIQAFNTDMQQKHTAETPTCSSKPACYALTKDNLNKSSTSAMIPLLSNNIVNLVGHKSPLPNIIRSSSPACQEYTLYLAKGHHDPSTTLCCAMSQHTLSTSYHTYLHSLPQLSNLPSCRLSALRLAQTANKSITTILDNKSCFPCRCPDTLAYHLDNLSTDLQSYTKHRCWDFYHQSPWVAGNHILEMLDISQYYGMRLFRYRHFLGAVLHTYNVLQQLAGLDPLPLLEQLCEQFKDVFFPGGERPRRNFRASWTRYIGARIKFQKGHRKRDSKGESWCMAVPAYAARAAAGLGVGMDCEGRARCVDEAKDVGSLLFQIKREGWHMTTDVVRKINRRGSGSGPDHYGARCQKDNVCGEEQLFISAVAAVDGLFTPNTDRPMPEGLVNHFAIFDTCLKIIGKISTSSHGDKKDVKDSLPSYCICFATSLLQSADRIVEGRRMGRLEAWKKHERELVELVKKHISEAMAEIEDGAWMWKL